METLIGRQLGNYIIQAEIGRGGMAVVYRAYQPVLERYVAIKVLPQQFTFDREFVERFLREARAAVRPMSWRHTRQTVVQKRKRLSRGGRTCLSIIRSTGARSPQ